MPDRPTDTHTGTEITYDILRRHLSVLILVFVITSPIVILSDISQPQSTVESSVNNLFTKRKTTTKPRGNLALWEWERERVENLKNISYCDSLTNKFQSINCNNVVVSVWLERCSFSSCGGDAALGRRVCYLREELRVKTQRLLWSVEFWE